MSVGLENIQPGDKVGIYHHHSHQWTEATVERTTPMQIQIKKTKFRRRDGYEITSGSKWYRDRIAAFDHVDSWSGQTTIAQMIEQGKAEAIERERRAKAITVIYAQTWRDLSTETLEAIAALLPKRDDGSCST